MLCMFVLSAVLQTCYTSSSGITLSLPSSLYLCSDLSYNPFPRLPAPGEGFPHLQVLNLVGCPNLLVVPLPNATKRIEVCTRW